jgi:hypothetical protein
VLYIPFDSTFAKVLKNEISHIIGLKYIPYKKNITAHGIFTMAIITLFRLASPIVNIIHIAEQKIINNVRTNIIVAVKMSWLPTLSYAKKFFNIMPVQNVKNKFPNIANISFFFIFLSYLGLSQNLEYRSKFTNTTVLTHHLSGGLTREHKNILQNEKVLLLIFFVKWRARPPST